MHNMLDSFDHVVVVMLENRSFDNLLGYVYPNGVPDGAPLGKTFNGVTGKNLSNPVPKNATHQPPQGDTVTVSPTCDYHQPYPDPGETYPHVNTQLFNIVNGENDSPYNLPEDPVPSEPACMQGFVTDYIENYKVNEEHKVPTFEEYAQIMQSFEPTCVPVLATLAEEFAVFDHWYCAVPSQTWCNRAFWNAGTSWGHVVNGGNFSDKVEIENTYGWIKDSIGTTIFNQIEESGPDSPITWNIYTDNIIPLTGVIHFRALKDFMLSPADHFHSFKKFLEDCANGDLPSYSFVEPRFFNPHNDMHPSSVKGLEDGTQAIGSVLLGEKFVLDIYNAIKNSDNKKGSNWQNTLLVITFDEHGGCFDHVSPPSGATPPDLDGYKLWMDFKYDRLGVRVPMIMVSAHIAKNTVVNTSLHHNSFMATMQSKWEKSVPGKFPPLTARVETAPHFHEVFTAPEPRPPSQWPDICEPVIPPEHKGTDFTNHPLNDLQRSIAGGAKALRDPSADPAQISDVKTVGEAVDLMQDIREMMGKGKI